MAQDEIFSFFATSLNSFYDNYVFKNIITIAVNKIKEKLWNVKEKVVRVLFIKEMIDKIKYITC